MSDEALTVEGPHPAGDDAVVVGVRGELTFANVEALTRTLREALAADAQRLVIDITGVPFMDSSGMSALLVASRDARAEGRTVAVVHAGDRPPGILRFKGVSKLIELLPSTDAAAS